MEIPKSRSVVLGLAVLAFTAIPSLHASTLYIDPTFDPSLTAADQTAISAAISAVEGAITSPNNITVSIYFTATDSGLGESETGMYGVSYYQYYNAFAAVATQPDQLTALSSLGTAPTNNSSASPVDDDSTVDITSAEGRNLGFNTPAAVDVGGIDYDGEILLNTSITSPPNTLSGNYSLQAAANHEIDEVLGIGGTGSTLGSSLTGVGDLDLYRYSAPGVRSYSTVNTTSPYAYFSIDGGETVLSYFNQTSGADFGDWLSNPIPNGFSPQVQDAFATPGTNPTLGPNELTAFNAIGYDLTAPEPSTISLLFAGFSVLAGVAYRRRPRSTHA